MPPHIAVLIPCLNEECSIATVVADFRRALPDAAVHVYDNNSTDQTCAVAAEAGAIVGTESLQGKGHTVRRMFHEIEADFYILVDGDDTYDAAAAPGMLELLVRDELAMVVARRCGVQAGAWPRGHRLGNALFTSAIDLLFGSRLHDVLSGYRAFSRRFVKSFEISAGGFELETELTVHALTHRLPIREIDTPYKARHEGSASKLRTWTDGLQIARSILRLAWAAKRGGGGRLRQPRP